MFFPTSFFHLYFCLIFSQFSWVSFRFHFLGQTRCCRCCWFFSISPLYSTIARYIRPNAYAFRSHRHLDYLTFFFSCFDIFPWAPSYSVLCSFQLRVKLWSFVYFSCIGFFLGGSTFFESALAERISQNYVQSKSDTFSPAIFFSLTPSKWKRIAYRTKWLYILSFWCLLSL